MSIEKTGLFPRCTLCGETIADRSTFIPTTYGPMHPVCWESGSIDPRLAAKDAEIAALRKSLVEAENFIDCHISDIEDYGRPASPGYLEIAKPALARIRAALEMSGGVK